MMNREEKIMAVLRNEISEDELSADDILYLEDCLMDAIANKIVNSGRGFFIEAETTQ